MTTHMTTFAKGCYDWFDCSAIGKFSYRSKIRSGVWRLPIMQVEMRWGGAQQSVLFFPLPTQQYPQPPELLAIDCVRKNDNAVCTKLVPPSGRCQGF